MFEGRAAESWPAVIVQRLLPVAEQGTDATGNKHGLWTTVVAAAVFA